jgi:osmotically inducible protein OsmC
MALAERRAEVIWSGELMKGNGQLTLQSSGALKNAPVTWASRTENPDGRTSPEEMLAAAHAECYAMGLSATLARGGNTPERLDVLAVASIDRKPEGGIQVTTMDLSVRGRVPGIDQQAFQEAAQKAEQSCPISNAIRNNVQITLKAQLDA